MMHSLVIGGTRGIGRAVVRMFAAEGHRVTAIGRRPPSERVTGVTYLEADLLDPKRIDDVFSSLGKLNNLVFMQRYRGQDDAWTGEIETTLTATKTAIEQLAGKFEKPAAIVMMSSIIAEHVVHNQPVSYHVGKAGINQLVRYYAVTLGEQGIRVNGVAPATTLKDESKDVYLKDEKLLGLYQKMIPLRRMGTAEEVAQVIGFLCSEKSSFVTGQVITVDGGLTLQFPESLVRCISGI
jgi:NAD(P)-dependent dehydrogenase (short-subunit alcohol dehydrogenase family)